MIEPVNDSLRNVGRPAGRWVVRLARWGFVANAVVYSLIGGLALKWALGAGGRITDAEGALLTLRRESLGQPLLAALAIGFFSYALWRVVGAMLDADSDGRSAKGILLRLGGAGKGIAYAAVGVRAMRLAQGAALHGAASSSPGAVAADILGVSGLWLLGILALIFGAYECYRGYAAKLSESLRLGAVGGTARRWIVGISRAGIAARGAVIMLLGVGLLRTAAGGGSGRPPGTAQLLRRAVQGQQHTDWMFLVIGAGLIAYAVYLVVLARYRELRVA